MKPNNKLGADIAGALTQLRELNIMMPEALAGTTDGAGNYMPSTAAEEHIFK